LTIKWLDQAVKDLKKIDKSTQQKIRDYLVNRIANSENPRQFGQSLSGTLPGFWRYRIGGYRILCRIDDKKVSVMVVRVAHRSRVYKKH